MDKIIGNVGRNIVSVGATYFHIYMVKFKAFPRKCGVSNVTNIRLLYNKLLLITSL